MAKGKTQPVKIVGAEEIRSFLAGAGHDPISEMHLSRLVADGMPKLDRGRYDALACMHWYLGKLRVSVQRKATEGEEGAPARNVQDERARLISAQADTAEMERDERRGLLLPMDVHEKELTSWAHTTKQLILGLPARVAPKLEGMPREKIKSTLEHACRGCCVELAGVVGGVPGPAPKRKRKS